jgi:acyl-CoA thioesterase-1
MSSRTLSERPALEYRCCTSFATIRLKANLALLALLLATVACGPGAPERPAPPAQAGDAAAQEEAGEGGAEGADDRPRVVVLGTSLSAGLGLPAELAYPALLQERIDAAGLGFRVINAGVSGDTSAGGLRRIEWLAREPIPVLLLELGANDMLRGLPAAALRENLQRIIDRTRAANPGARIVVAGMRAAPNLGAEYAAGFEQSFGELARANGAALIPFILEGVAGVPELNQSDGIHPTAEGHRRIADTVWTVLEPLLRELAPGQGASAPGGAARPQPRAAP